MSPIDEQELQRLSAMLASIEDSLPNESPLREGAVKAALGLSLAFILGRRQWIEDIYAHLDAPLSDDQLARLINLGIDPEA